MLDLISLWYTAPMVLDIPFDMEVAHKLSHKGAYIVLWCTMYPILVVISFQLLF